MNSIELSTDYSPRTIAFLVKKPAQFDVPLFRHIQQSGNSKWRFVVVYLGSPLQELHDVELNTKSDWGINLTDGYEWHCLGKENSQEDMTGLFNRLMIGVVITNGYKNDYAPFLKVAKALEIPVGLRIDSVLFGLSATQLFLRKALIRWTYRQFKGFLTTGSQGVAYLNHIGIPDTRQFWFPYCTDNDFFRFPERLPTFNIAFKVKEREQVILGICKFNQRENPFALLNAFCEINDPSLQLVFIGDGPLMPALVAYAVGFPALSIHFTGFVPYLQLPFWYHHASVFVHTAFHEPWGVSVQEALAAGCRVVASSRVGSAYDLVKVGENGFLYPVNQPQQLSGYIQKAMALPEPSVQKSTSRLLWGKWNYDSVWQELQRAAEEMARDRSE